MMPPTDTGGGAGMMPGTGDGTGDGQADMTPGTGDGDGDTGMMPGTGDGDGDTAMMPGTGDGDGDGDTPMAPPGTVSGLVPSPASPVFAQSDGDTLGSLQPQGGEFAPLTATVARIGGAVSAPAEGAAYLKSVSSDGSGGFQTTYVIEGEDSSIHFTSDGLDGTAYRKQRDDGAKNEFWSHSGSFSSAPRDGGHPDYDYFDVVGWNYGLSEGGNYQSYSVYGVQTAPENLPATGTAAYDGDIQFDFFNADDVRASTSRSRIQGKLTLEANFDDSEISGQADRLRIRLPGETNYTQIPGNSLAISGGEINGSRFTADWAGEDADASSAPEDSVRGFSGKILGEFYGPAAEEVGGVLNGSRAATATTPEQHAIGFIEGRERAVSGVKDSTEEFTPITNAVERDHINTMVRAAGQGEAYVKSIARDGAGGFRVTYVANNKESSVHFEAGDRSATGPNFRKQRGDLIQLLIFYTQYDFLQYLDVNAWIHHEGFDVEKGSYWGFSVHGVRTAPENLPTSGSATYKGRMRTNVWSANDPDSVTGRIYLRSNGRSNLTLEADFENNGISGRIEGLETRTPDVSDYSLLADTNAIDISNGSITGNGFTADWTGVDTNANSEPADSVRGFSGTMNGHFYGPAAEEVGGLMSGNRAATATTPEQIVTGAFGAKKME